MSTFETEGYQWRETYFVLFESARRPKLDEVRRRLAKLDRHFHFSHASADEQDRIESLTVTSPDDFAALDISYIEGSEVLEQGAALAAEYKKTADPADAGKLARLRELDARFDVMHFENLAGMPLGDEQGPDEMLDPSALLVVLDDLIELTGGVGIDPQSGTLI